MEVGIKPKKRTEASSQTEKQAQPEQVTADDNHAGQELESGFGEYGLAFIGNVVLFFGVVFLMQYIHNQGFRIASILLGSLIAGGALFLSHSLRVTYSYLARIFSFTGQVLLFYVTLRLHFFLDNPVLTSEALAIILLLIIVAGQLYYAVRRRSALNAGLAFIMAMMTAMVTDSTHMLLFLVTLTAAAATFFFFRYGWWKLLLFSIILVYLTFLTWFTGNPVMGRPFVIVASHQLGILYLFAIAASFSLVALENKNSQLSEGISISAIMLSGSIFSLLLLLFVLSFFKTDYILIFSMITAYCLSYAVVLNRSRSSWKFAPAFFALFGFMAMSIAVYGIYGFPNAYWLLAVQSLLVVSMALGFRNKLIVIMNTFLFFIMYVVYISTSSPVNEVNFSFAFVALATARILNWKKGRLEIKTEYLRNSYLLMAFIMVLYALYHALPGNWITLAWTITAIVYFVFSILLKNVKYRYMALATMLATAIYLFAIDLARVEIVYRVLAFLFLAIISIIISVYYTRKVKKSRKKEVEIN